MTNKTILIVEDEVEIAQFLKEYIEGEVEDAQITVADNGVVALASTTESKFDIIFCDLQMPVMSGTDFFKTIRMTSNPNKETAVVFISATVDVVLDDGACGLENAYFLDKPIDFGRLNRYLNIILNHRNKQ